MSTKLHPFLILAVLTSISIAAQCKSKIPKTPLALKKMEPYNEVLLRAPTWPLMGTNKCAPESKEVSSEFTTTFKCTSDSVVKMKTISAFDGVQTAISDLKKMGLTVTEEQLKEEKHPWGVRFEFCTSTDPGKCISYCVPKESKVAFAVSLEPANYIDLNFKKLSFKKKNVPSVL